MGIAKSKRKSPHFVLLLLLGFAAFFAAPKKAQACCSCTFTAFQSSSQEWLLSADSTILTINGFVRDEFIAHRSWLASTLFEDNILPAMQLMAEQLSAVAMQQMVMVGSFFDAKHQMETQQAFQKLQARAHKDYQPSVGMCEFGTNTKSLAASERKSEYTAVVLAQRSQDRALGNSNSAAATGEVGDKNSRIAQFRESFCDPADNNNGLGVLCKHDNGVGAASHERKNKDIDFVRTVSTPWTLDIDFTDGEPTDHEKEVFALASNLYGHNVFPRIGNGSALGPPDPRNINDVQKSYQDARAVVAKRSVAENSFNAITSMKAQGTEGSRDFMRAVLSELGAEGGDVDSLVNAELNPSYYAQMEVLTKKIFQNPDFYTNLYDKPANVQRKNVALQAISLMQKFDLFKSYLRNEASMSVLLELAVMDLQEEVDNELGRITSGGLPGR